MMVDEKKVNKIRTYLRRLANGRNSRSVTASDVHRWLDKNTKVRSNAVGTRLAYINSAFSSPEFVQIGMTPSSRPAARGRMISEWTTVKQS